MTIILTAFERSPDSGQRLARDTPIRWGLEEVGHVHELRRGSFRTMKEPVHLTLNPFGQAGFRGPTGDQYHPARERAQ